MSQINIDFPLSKIANGAIQEKLDIELKKVFENIHDKNTDAVKKRTVTIKLTFEPDSDRHVVKVESDFTTKLADVEGVSTTIRTGKDIASGRVEARELKSNVPGQTYFDEDGPKTDVGEPVDVIEKEMERKNKITNLREVNKR